MYPEHKKVREIQPKSQAIHEFIDWLIEKKNIHLAEAEDEDEPHENLVYTRSQVGSLVAEFFEIDLKKFHAEKDQMVEEMRKANEQPTV